MKKLNIKSLKKKINCSLASNKFYWQNQTTDWQSKKRKLISKLHFVFTCVKLKFCKFI